MSFQIFQWVFTFFSGIWKPNSKSHLSAAWCLLLTPRHEPLGWLAITVFDWRKNKCFEKLWCLSHPTSPICWLNYLRRQLMYNLFFIYCNTSFVCIFNRYTFVCILFSLLSGLILSDWYPFESTPPRQQKFEWVLKIWVSFQNLSEF